jgi:hypothetical protein
MDEPIQSRKPEDDGDEERDRRVTNIFLVTFFVFVVGAGIWLVNAMIEQRQIDNCVGQGRRNCAPIDTSGR